MKLIKLLDKIYVNITLQLPAYSNTGKRVQFFNKNKNKNVSRDTSVLCFSNSVWFLCMYDIYLMHASRASLMFCSLIGDILSRQGYNE